MERTHGFAEVYSTEQCKLIQSEFVRLNDHHYLDHAGATLHSEIQLQNVFQDLQNSLYANPHSKSNSSHLTSDCIDQLRYMILEFFNTNSDEYSVIFTSNATDALKIIAESTSLNVKEFIYLEDNHTSVLGMREYYSKITPLSIEKALKIFGDEIKSSVYNQQNNQQDKNCNTGIFVYPAQSNFSGTKYPLKWIEKVHKNILNTHDLTNCQQCYCVLDAASFVGTNYLNLGAFKPDFVPISFYKIFGYPTGIGALLVKNTSSEILTKRYYGGGTVFLASASKNLVVRRKDLQERFEDGTLNFQSILALKHGFDTFKRLSLTMNIISKHTYNLAAYFFKNIATLCHSNGKNVATVYTLTSFDDVATQGGIVNFNLIRKDGSYVGYAEVMHFANLHLINLRTGCFCNPGACQFHLKLTSDDIIHQFNQGHVCGDNKDLIDGYPTGSIRISFGYMTTKNNVDAMLDMIEDCFVEKPIIRKPDVSTKNVLFTNNNGLNCDNTPLETNNKFKHEKCENDMPRNNTLELNGKVVENANQISGVLEDIYIYPIKSCGHFKITGKWKLISTGLKFDRQWMIVNSSGICLTQKRDTYLCLIKPEVDLKDNVLILRFEELSTNPICNEQENLHGQRGVKPIHVPLDLDCKGYKLVEICQGKVCGDKIKAIDCGDDVADWLSDVLNTTGLRLLRQIEHEDSRVNKTGDALNLSLSNQSQFLMLNLSTVKWLFDRIPENDRIENIDQLTHRFRPNFVVDLASSFLEQQIAQMIVDGVLFHFDGKCTRCQMICINQATGEKTIEPLKTLSRETGGKISFGVYLCRKNSESSYISPNSPINVKLKE